MSTQLAGHRPAAASTAYRTQSSTTQSPAAQSPAAQSPAALPAATAEPAGEPRREVGLSWVDIAMLVLQDRGRPMRAPEMITRASELGLTAKSRTRTPAQSMNRDLHAAARRTGAQIVTGPGAGEFHLAAGPAGELAADWVHIATAVLSSTGTPMTAREILRAARTLALLPAPTRGSGLSAGTLRERLLVHLDDVSASPGALRTGPGRHQFQLAAPATPRAGKEGRTAPAPRTPAPRLPVEPLVAYVNRAGGFASLGLVADSTCSASWRRFVDRTYRSYQRSVARGWVDIWAADTLAVHALGVHPCIVWREAWWSSIAEPVDGVSSTSSPTSTPAAA